MRAAAIPVLAALAGPAAGETWVCTTDVACTTGGGCEDGQGLALRLLLLPGGWAEMVVNAGDPAETRHALRPLPAQGAGKSFMTQALGGTLGFVTLYPDGTLAATAHEAGPPVWASAGTGTCRAEGA